MIDIPVFLIAPDGTITDDPVAGCPCIKATFVPGDDSYGGLGAGVDAWALLDTGADQVFVDASFSAMFGSPAVAEAPVHGATSSIISTVHSAFVRVGTLPPISLQYTAAPLVREYPRYQIALGRSFLRLFDFRFDGRTGAFS